MLRSGMDSGSAPLRGLSGMTAHFFIGCEGSTSLSRAGETGLSELP
jgi:hypothetical protein